MNWQDYIDKYGYCSASHTPVNFAGTKRVDGGYICHECGVMLTDARMARGSLGVSIPRHFPGDASVPKHDEKRPKHA